MIAIFAVLALVNLSQGQEHVARKLGYSKCSTVLDLNDRCCGEDLSACKCPVRETERWWLKWVQRKWEYKCKDYAERAPGCNIPKVADESGIFKTLLSAVEAAGLVDALSQVVDEDTPALTVFAPTDEAFGALGDIVPCLLKDDNIPKLKEILLYHVVSGKVLSTDLTDGQVVPTLLEQNIVVDLTEGVKINSSNVIKADVMASNGVIHIIDSVLVPDAFDLGECTP